MRLLALLLILATTPSRAEELSAWLADFRPRAEAAGIASATLDRALPDIEHLPDVIRRDRNQSEFSKTIWDYLDGAVSDLRVQNGRAALQRHSAAFDAIEARYGVEKEVVAAIWGLESSYGAFRGDTSTLSALATLAADSRRGAFFETQLIAALQILQAGDTTFANMRGSWAGAMGHTQFIPTSFLAHAVDFTGDGRRDIWGQDPTDALASAAAYLADFGWTTGQPWGVEVILPDGFDYALAASTITKRPAEWTALGIRTAAGGALPGDAPVSIRAPAGAQGAVFATYPNFEVLERYNTADAYVIGVGHLSDRLTGGPPLRAGWPRGDRALSFDERVEMQRLLAGQGFDPQKFDGLVGPLTLAAIRGWQASVGLVPDGYMPPRLLQRLRGS
ncbi:MAG: lytic murein transglycosylase [Pseudomonadota bacterium]